MTTICTSGIAAIIYYGELGPYFKSAEAKAQYQSMSTSNDPLTYLPVLEDPTLAGCLNAMDDYQDAYDGIISLHDGHARFLPHHGQGGDANDF